MTPQLWRSLDEHPIHISWADVPAGRRHRIGDASAAGAQTAERTFTKDIAPILQARCQSCHRPGEMAPMSLRTYQEVRPWVRSIRNKVSRREMPPWFIDRTIGIQQYKNDASLTEAEIATIVQWADAGAREGNSADMPAAKTFPDSRGGILGRRTSLCRRRRVVVGWNLLLLGEPGNADYRQVESAF